MKHQSVERKIAFVSRVLPLLLIALCLTGCLAPLRQSQPVFSSKQIAPSNRQKSGQGIPNTQSKTSASVVRGQGPNEYFGSRPSHAATTYGQAAYPGQPAPNATAGGQSYGGQVYGGQGYAQAAAYQSPVGATAQGQVAAGQIQPVQYTSPDALWGLAPQATPAGVSPYNAVGNAPGPGYPAPSAAAVPPATFPGQSGTLWSQSNPVGPPGYAPTNNVYGEPVGPPGTNGILGLPTDLADIIVNVQETQTGRFMVGAAVNSDAGVTGQIVIDERNFAFPTTIPELLGEGGYRGRGQGLRIEALPGSQVQRYMVQFTEPYLLDTRVSMNLSAYLFDRQFFDWDEERLGGRFGLGYRVTPDLSLSASLRAERVTIKNPRLTDSVANPAFDENIPQFIDNPATPDVIETNFPNPLYEPPTLSAAVPSLASVVGDQDVFSARFTMTQDTRDIPFQPTQGYYFEAAFEQVFGTYNYSRFDLDMRRYFLLAERADGSGRHVLGFSNKLGISGDETPIFENYFAGGYSTMRGFDFRRASPQDKGVTTGGRFQLLGSAEYLFPITADDMVKGVAFVDYGTVEEDIKIESEDFRVALGFGLRVNIPAMGPAPIALDFAVPIAREETDEIRGFSFFMGVSR